MNIVIGGGVTLIFRSCLQNDSSNVSKHFIKTTEIQPINNPRFNSIYQLLPPDPRTSAVVALGGNES